jgi:hypothetical protein
MELSSISCPSTGTSTRSTCLANPRRSRGFIVVVDADSRLPRYRATRCQLPPIVSSTRWRGETRRKLPSDGSWWLLRFTSLKTPKEPKLSHYRGVEGVNSTDSAGVGGVRHGADRKVRVRTHNYLLVTIRRDPFLPSTTRPAARHRPSTSQHCAMPVIWPA